MLIKSSVVPSWLQAVAMADGRLALVAGGSVLLAELQLRAPTLANLLGVWERSPFSCASVLSLSAAPCTQPGPPV